MSYTKVADIKLNPKAPKLPDGYTGTFIPRWLDEVPGLYPLKDVRIAAYILSYNRNDQTCYVSDNDMCAMFAITNDALRAALTRLKKAGILSIGRNKRGRTLTIHQPITHEPSALDDYIANEYKKRDNGNKSPENQVIPNNQDNPENQVTTDHEYYDNPENQVTAYPENQVTAYPENQGRILKQNIQMNNISIHQDCFDGIYYNINGQREEESDIWAEWEEWFKNARRMKLPGLYAKHIRDISTDAPIGIRDIASAFEKGYDPAIILQVAVEACNSADPDPRTTMREALAKRTKATEQFQAEAADYLYAALKEAIDGFCQSKRMDTETFKQAVGNKYGIDYLRSNQA